MGFKDLTSFNVAMLGKQGWKFQTHLSILVTRLFKARYFPNCDFIRARIGHNPSYVWRSIFSAKVVVKRGARWRIGSGENIPILGAPWLRDGKCLSTNGPLTVPLAHVNSSAFNDQPTKTWKAPLIYNLFEVTTANWILSTHFQPLVSNDKLI